MKTAAIIQARMSSSRLPGKVLTDLAGRPMLWHVVERTARAQEIDQVVVATSDQPGDDPIQEFCNLQGVFCFRGSLDDVLDRYHACAREIGADNIVRITADCPLLDAGVIDRLIGFFLDGGYDFASTGVERATFPDGISVEVFTARVLEFAWQGATLKSEREHVMPYFHKNSKGFKVGEIHHPVDLSALRWTVDEKEDLEFARKVFESMGKDYFGMEEILDLLKREPELTRINSHFIRDEGYRISLAEDGLFQGLEAE